eukprot:TRINITY_DN4639_c2_g1_i2.p2 TRINITY_DN4639_c2_g1~~TRINITY_DN4639_c2_g1_i2.p2  ORF type:complete len:299 (-),score=39.63 TRINITY_DN4639_c2_g1_i2:292-1188(-)
MEEDRAHALYKQLQQVDYGARAKKGLGFGSSMTEDDDEKNEPREIRWQKGSEFVRGGEIKFCKAGENKRTSLEHSPTYRISKEEHRKQRYNRRRSRSRSPRKSYHRRSSPEYSRQQDTRSYRRAYSPSDKRSRSSYDRSKSSGRYYKERYEGSKSNNSSRNYDMKSRSSDENKMSALDRIKSKTREIIDSKTQAYIEDQAPNISQRDLALGGQDGVHVAEVEQTHADNYQGQNLQGALDHQSAIFGRYDGRHVESTQLSEQKKEDAVQLLNNQALKNEQESWRDRLIKLQRERQTGLK